jgi:hypothetical protein
MSKTADLSVLTANRLADGTVVFLDFEGAWNESLAEAVVARSPDEVRALQDRGAHDAARNLVVEPYLAEVRETPAGLIPMRARERVRVAGPSILDDVPGYVSPQAVLRQAQPGGGASGSIGDPGLQAERAHHPQPGPELVEGRAEHAEAA